MNLTISETLMTIAQWHHFPKTNQFWDEEKTRELSYGSCWGSNGERDYMRQLALDALNYNNQIVENCLWKIISLIDNIDNMELINLGREILKLNNNHKFSSKLDIREREYVTELRYNNKYSI